MYSLRQIFLIFYSQMEFDSSSSITLILWPSVELKFQVFRTAESGLNVNMVNRRRFGYNVLGSIDGSIMS